jgi:hypothetical protein
VIFKVDMANAFNSLRCDVFLAAARERTQSLYRLLWQEYSEPTSLFYGKPTLISATGIQQADPFGPAIFSIGVDGIVQQLNTELNIWYLDDGTISDTPEKVFECVRGLVDSFRGVGMEFNQSKCG